MRFDVIPYIPLFQSQCHQKLARNETESGPRDHRLKALRLKQVDLGVDALLSNTRRSQAFPVPIGVKARVPLLGTPIKRLTCETIFLIIVCFSESVTSAETFNASGSVDKSRLLSSVEWVALPTNIYPHCRLNRERFMGRAANTCNNAFHHFRMYFGFHRVLL